MDFVSTRDVAVRTSFAGALRQGLAPDGGLFMPAEWPLLTPADGGAIAPPADLRSAAATILGPFVAGDEVEAMLPGILDEAFNFAAPTVSLKEDGRLSVLELFHGPTAAFKDFGARFLAAAFERLQRQSSRVVNILVATSGDTGGAVAAAFHGRPGVRVTLLFPKGLVSPTQERQLTCWGGNVVSCSVRGTFDDCQHMVKDAMLDRALAARLSLSSANSINIGRLLPQAAYYASASLEAFARYREPLSFIIPSGNLGNAFACVLARRIGMPIGEIVLAHNANRAMVDFLESGEWRPRASVATLASAMDVGDPSNLERLRALYPGASGMAQAISAHSVDDGAIKRRIAADAERHGRVWCPHTATAAEVYARLPRHERESGRWCIVATAHPAKFPEVVGPLTGLAVEVPEALKDLFTRTPNVEEIDASLVALRRVLEG